MNRFSVNLSIDELNLPLCVTSGQVFRWSSPDGQSWHGHDGPNWYRCQIFPEKIHVESNATVVEFCKLFNLHVNLAELRNEITSAGPEMIPYFDTIKGLRVLAPDPVETVFAFLCTPNNHLSRIHRMVNFLGDQGRDRGFPTIAEVAAIPEQSLREQGFGYRSATIPSAAREMIERGPAWFSKMESSPYSEVISELLSIRGIGPKLADCIALFAFRKHEAVPVDTHIWQASTRLYFPEWAATTLTAAKYQAVGRLLRGRFGDRAGWVQQYLFYDNMIAFRSRKPATLPAN